MQPCRDIMHTESRFPGLISAKLGMAGKVGADIGKILLKLDQLEAIIVDVLSAVKAQPQLHQPQLQTPAQHQQHVSREITAALNNFARIALVQVCKKNVQHTTRTSLTPVQRLAIRESMEEQIADATRPANIEVDGLSCPAARVRLFPDDWSPLISEEQLNVLITDGFSTLKSALKRADSSAAAKSPSYVLASAGPARDSRRDNHESHRGYAHAPRASRSRTPPARHQSRRRDSDHHRRCDSESPHASRSDRGHHGPTYRRRSPTEEPPPSPHSSARERPEASPEAPRSWYQPRPRSASPDDPPLAAQYTITTTKMGRDYTLAASSTPPVRQQARPLTVQLLDPRAATVKAPSDGEEGDLPKEAEPEPAAVAASAPRRGTAKRAK